jgi:hypothetical protein
MAPGERSRILPSLLGVTSFSGVFVQPLLDLPEQAAVVDVVGLLQSDAGRCEVATGRSAPASCSGASASVR